MSNKGWDSTQGGSSVASNARTTGRTSGCGEAESFIQGSKIADHGDHNDPLGSPDDLFGAPGQLSTC